MRSSTVNPSNVLKGKDFEKVVRPKGGNQRDSSKLSTKSSAMLPVLKQSKSIRKHKAVQASLKKSSDVVATAKRKNVQQSTGEKIRAQ